MMGRQVVGDGWSHHLPLVRMYVPRFNSVEDDDLVREMVREARVAWLVTVGVGGAPLATLLPIIWEGDVVITHMARANHQWREIADGDHALLIVPGPEAYVSPSWYQSKREHGRVVPTWNYTEVHLTGPATVHEEPEWLREAVTELTLLHEGPRPEPWHVEDAPEGYVDGLLRAIVGIEFRVDKVEAKAKLSQNRDQADRLGVIEGLAGEQRLGAPIVAAAMKRLEETEH